MQKQKEVIYLSPDSIKPNLFQPRKYFNQESIEELAESIKAYGIIQPLSVRKMGQDLYELVAGERRLRASKLAGLESVPVIIVDINDKESAAIALLENLQREDLNFLEEAEAYYNLIREHGFTQEKLAEQIGKKQSTIANKLRVLKLDSSVREALIKENLTERHARALLKLPELKLQQEILAVVVEKSLNVKETEQVIEKYLLKLMHDENNIGKDGKKRIKGIFASSIYVNTIKQVFDKFGIDAKYKAKELDDSIEVVVRIPKPKS